MGDWWAPKHACSRGLLPTVEGQQIVLGGGILLTAQGIELETLEDLIQALPVQKT
jgi:hypothetical protein